MHAHTTWVCTHPQTHTPISKTIYNLRTLKEEQFQYDLWFVSIFQGGDAQTYQARVDVYEYSPFLSDGALHGSPHKEIWEAICVEVHCAERRSEVRAELFQSRAHAQWEDSIIHWSSQRPQRQRHIYLFTFHFMDDAQLLFLDAEYICLQVGEEFKTFTSLADFKKTNLFNWNINLCIIHNWTNIKKY